MDEPRWLNQTEMQAWAGFLEASDLLNRLVELHLREAGGLTRVQYEILHRLNESPESVRMTELASLMVCSPSGLNYQVGQLVKRELVQRDPDPSDERGILVSLTEQGRAVLLAAAPGHVATIRAGLIDLLSEQQVAQLATIMTVARDHLRSVVPTVPSRKTADKRS
ncbi:MarR family winged helix-turn-helix transcriptional regulator [Microtetraspora malaysiensis]|uniref:MarR family winged helix-turn-helix transcriptional regulator n=1 Tax=Microtetraspora malaysiensis TaxID=161358 RepID=UPI003D9038F0